EDGIRYDLVTGIQTCAPPICSRLSNSPRISCRPGQGPLLRGFRVACCWSDFQDSSDSCDSLALRLASQAARNPEIASYHYHNREIGRASWRERVVIVVGECAL